MGHDTRTRLLIARFVGLAALVSRVVKVGPVRVLVVARFGRDCGPEDAELSRIRPVDDLVSCPGRVFDSKNGSGEERDSQHPGPASA